MRRIVAHPTLTLTGKIASVLFVLTPFLFWMGFNRLQSHGFYASEGAVMLMVAAGFAFLVSIVMLSVGRRFEITIVDDGN